MRQLQRVGQTQQVTLRPELGLRQSCDEEIEPRPGLTISVDLQMISQRRIRPVVMFQRPGHQPLVISWNWLRIRKFRNWIGSPSDFLRNATLTIRQQDPECPETLVQVYYRGRTFERVMNAYQCREFLLFPYSYGQEDCLPEPDELWDLAAS